MDEIIQPQLPTSLSCRINKNPAYRKPLNLSMWADSSTLLTPVIYTVGWFAKKEIYVLRDQPMCQARKNRHNFLTNGAIFR